jgi:DinB family protein
MEIESPTFTADDIHAFLGETREHERGLLVQRLEAIGPRLERLRPRLLALGDVDSGGDAGWTAREIVAHLALVSKLYGVIAYRVAAGKETAYDLLGIVRLRDVAGEEAARLPIEQHLDAIAADHARTLAFLRTAPIEDLERDAETGIEGLKMRAVDVLRLPLIAHLELHLDQLDRALG